MDDNLYYRKFLQKTNSELRLTLNNHGLYNKEAIVCALHILKEREIELSEEERLLESSLGEYYKQNVPEQKKSEVSLLRKRIQAILIDFAFLSGISFLIGFIFMNSSILEPPFEPVFSFFLILGYLVFFNSSIGKQTFGKSRNNIAVVDYNKKPLSLARSLARFMLLISPYFLFNFLDTIFINSYGLLGGLRYSYYMSLVYFPISDTSLKRGFHDIIVKSVVICKMPENSDFNYPKGKLKIYGLIVAGIMASFVLFTISSRNQLAWDNVLNFDGTLTSLHDEVQENKSLFDQIISRVQKIEGVIEIEGMTVSITNGVKSLDVVIRTASIFSNDFIIDRAYKELRSVEIGVLRLDNVKIVLQSGFNMTLAWFNRELTKNFPQ